MRREEGEEREGGRGRKGGREGERKGGREERQREGGGDKGREGGRKRANADTNGTDVHVGCSCTLRSEGDAAV